MLFYLTTMNLTHIILEECPKPTDPTSKESMMTVDAWKNSDFLCMNYILNRLDDTLYDIYSLCNSAKELWDSLEKKYKTEDAGAKKFVLSKFLKYIMVDTKTIMKQVDELQVLIHELHLEGCLINDHFQVGAIIEKLPPSWNDFKIYLKHKRREMTMEDLILRLRVEEDHRKGDKNEAPIIEAKANMAEGKTSIQKFQKSKGKKRAAYPHAPKGKDFKKIKGSCSVYGKLGHKAMDCRFKKDQNAGSSMQKK